MLNYFNYFTEIEERFQQRRGSLLLLSTLDWALIETWREAGIPLEAVLRGIDAAFDKYEARQKRARMRRINGLAWCAQAVMEAAEELREAAAGTANRQPRPANRALSMNASPRILKPPQPLWMSRPLPPKPALQPPPACANWPVKSAPLGAPRSAAAMISKPWSAPSPCSKKNSSPLSTAAAPEELLVAQGTCRRELAPYRSRMGAVQLRQVEHQFVQKQLLVHYDLPRLSLFYMSQQ